MKHSNGYGVDAEWVGKGRKQQPAPSASSQSPSTAVPAAAVSSPSPVPTGEGTVTDKPSFIDMRLVFGGAVFMIALVVMLLVRSVFTAQTVTANQTIAAAGNASTPAVTEGAQSIAMVEQLSNEGQYQTAAYMAEKALRTAQLFPHERTRLQELMFNVKLHVLYEEPIAPLNVSAHEQALNHYRFLAQQAADMGVPFPTKLTVAEQAKAAEKFLLSTTLYEEAYLAGEFTKADQDIVRRYAGTLYTYGWWLAQHNTGAIKEHGLRLVAASYALEKELGIAQGKAWAELRKYKGADETKWPTPVDTPLLDTANGGS